MTSIPTNCARLIPVLALTFIAMTMKADTSTNKTLFDFQAATNLPAWEVVNDDVMGGVSTSQFQVLTNDCAVFSGTVRLRYEGIERPYSAEDVWRLRGSFDIEYSLANLGAAGS